MNALHWGLIGGGEGSQIGFAHRAAAALDRRFRFVAGALDACYRAAGLPPRPQSAE